MSDNHKEITNLEALDEINIMWSKWVKYERDTITRIHLAVAGAKSPIQNPCTFSKDEIEDYIRKISLQKKNAFDNSQAEFNKLFNETFAVLKKYCLT